MRTPLIHLQEQAEKIASLEKSVFDLEASVKEHEERESALKATLEKKVEQCANQADRVETYVQEVSSMKTETCKALQVIRRLKQGDASVTGSR
jgi:macrodomain Ter protein organizer (MatP/YcbG family)